jgi:hypothetical protein
MFGLSAIPIIMASKKLSVKPTELYRWGIFCKSQNNIVKI